MNELKYLRESRDLLQKDVAQVLGISRSAYSNYENGIRSPDPETLKRMADFFSVSVDKILGRSPLEKSQDSLSTQEQHLIKMYRSLSPIGKARTLQQISFELSMEKRQSTVAAPTFRVAESRESYNIPRS